MDTLEFRMEKRKSYRERLADWFADFLDIDGGSADTATVDDLGVVWIDVESSNVEAVGWEMDRSALWIRFGVDKKPRTYRYPDFPRVVYEEFLAAPSKGKFVWEVIRNGGRDDRFKFQEQ